MKLGGRLCGGTLGLLKFIRKGSVGHSGSLEAFLKGLILCSEGAEFPTICKRVWGSSSLMGGCLRELLQEGPVLLAKSGKFLCMSLFRQIKGMLAVCYHTGSFFVEECGHMFRSAYGHICLSDGEVGRVVMCLGLSLDSFGGGLGEI